MSTTSLLFFFKSNHITLHNRQSARVVKGDGWGDHLSTHAEKILKMRFPNFFHIENWKYI